MLEKEGGSCGVAWQVLGGLFGHCKIDMCDTEIMFYNLWKYENKIIIICMKSIYKQSNKKHTWNINIIWNNMLLNDLYIFYLDVNETFGIIFVILTHKSNNTIQLSFSLDNYQYIMNPFGQITI